MKPTHTILPLLAILLAAGCGQPSESSESSAPAKAPEMTAAIPEAFLSVLSQEVRATEAMSIVAIKQTAKEGDTITVEGKIMGTLHPFIDQRAVVMIGDESTITSCDLMASDRCKTPWDACCDSQDVLTAGMAMVQIVDADGTVIPQGLKGVKGMKELSHLRVTGTVVTAGNGALVINATGIQIK